MYAMTHEHIFDAWVNNIGTIILLYGRKLKIKLTSLQIIIYFNHTAIQISFLGRTYMILKYEKIKKN